MKNLITKFKKISLVFLTLLMISLPLAPTAKAAVTTSWYNQSFNDWYLKVYTGNDSEIFGERYTAAQVQWIIYSIYSQMIGIGVSNNTDVVACVLGKDVENCGDAIGNGFKDLVTYKNTEPKGVLAFISSNPFSGVNYTKSLISKFSIVPETHAQGFGFTVINPIQTLWKISRDISFGFLVLAIIIFAFMIMFKVKINPQTVITVQSALPKVAISAILITFSYAIAGFLIDLMYVAFALVIAILTNKQYGLFGYSFTEALSYLLSRNIFDIFIAYWFGFFITSLTTIASENIVQGLILTLFAIIAFFILLWNSGKTIYYLLKNLAMILLTIITGPLEILLGTINFSGGGFSQWIKRLVSYLAVYPIIALLIMLAWFFLVQGIPQYITAAIPTGFPLNPQPGALEIQGNTNWNVPFTVGEQWGMPVVWIIVSFVIITLIPKVFDMIKAFMEKKPFGVASGIGDITEGARIAGEISANLNSWLTARRRNSAPNWLQELTNRLSILQNLPKKP